MTSRRLWWWIYGACAAIVLLALVWVTISVLRLERAETDARADAAHQEALRLALWRMDSWLAPVLAQEAARPYFEYLPFYPQQRAYTRLLHQIEPGDVLAPSPLLSFQSEVIRLHFQVAGDGGLTSPQVPTGNLRDLAEDGFLPAARIAANTAQLRRLMAVLNEPELAGVTEESEERELAGTSDIVLQEPAAESDFLAADEEAIEQQARSKQEWIKRRGLYLKNVQASADVGLGPNQIDRNAAESVEVGSLTPLWIGPRDDSPAGELVFIRKVRVEDQTIHQGFLCDWPELREALRDQVSDLFPDARLIPVSDARADDAVSSTRLATIPVSLHVSTVTPFPVPGVTPTRSTLALTWVAVLVGLGAVAVTLRASIAFGEKRSRFASAVTHELRTPLTTFRMYTEMLADGMVGDEEKRRSYLSTLRDESGRLATLVENVLAYARLEDGRRAAHLQAIEVGEMFSRLRPVLERRAREAGLGLRVDIDESDRSVVRTDVDAVGQILFNLVDNACKYATGGTDAAIDLRVRIDGEALRLTVRDHGPGIPGGQSAAIFTPFERGASGASEKPGIGLGLALSRGLARDLGGDLTLKPCEGAGACFELTLPLRSFQ